MCSPDRYHISFEVICEIGENTLSLTTDLTRWTSIFLLLCLSLGCLPCLAPEEIPSQSFGCIPFCEFVDDIGFMVEKFHLLGVERFGILFGCRGLFGLDWDTLFSGLSV